MKSDFFETTQKFSYGVSVASNQFNHVKPRIENDAWIASTAIAHELILVTRNVGDFQNMPVKLLNPFNEN